MGLRVIMCFAECHAAPLAELGPAAHAGCLTLPYRRAPLPCICAGAKQSSDAAAREQLEKVVEVLVTGE